MSQQTYTFQAEIQQLLNILVHSLYTEREIFLRELVSNASDALNRVQFELLTNREALDADAELRIDILTDEEAGTLTISDTGIGMTRDDMVNNLGVIARSGAKAFIEAMKANAGTVSTNGAAAQDVIGQFGVGFYSVFMAADKVRVVSRSYKPDERAYAWESDGGDQYTIEEAERNQRGTDIIITLKEDAKDFLQSWTVKNIIRKHSDYIAFPIYVNGEAEATNKQTAIWRQSPSEITEDQYNDFYKSMTLDFEPPLHHLHYRADVPLQFYALLYFPATAEQTMFSLRKEPGLKLYARKVLIQEYSKDLLPEYLPFIQGVVDSEDLPLNVSRESVQANRLMANLKKTLTGRVLSELKRLLQKDREKYLTFYQTFGRFLKQGIVVSPTDRTELEPLLFFNSSLDDNAENWHSLEDYVGRFAQNQNDIYYIIADDLASARRSPHLDAFRQRGIEVLYLTDPVDAALVMSLNDYKGHTLHSVDEADLDLTDIGTLTEEPSPQTPLAEVDFETVRAQFAQVLGERVKDVRASRTLTGSAARLVSEESGANRQMFRINRLLDRDYELPVKTLELNPRHPLMHNVSGMIAQGGQQALLNAVIEQVFETALLQDGIHPDPASMADRITLLMQAATAHAFETVMVDTDSIIASNDATALDDTNVVTVKGDAVNVDGENIDTTD
ncbi:MAG: molecular chaperone HtpG [bacterium]|nr:molecular chaperone HtpG [bacterium]